MSKRKPRKLVRNWVCAVFTSDERKQRCRSILRKGRDATLSSVNCTKIIQFDQHLTKSSLNQHLLAQKLATLQCRKSKNNEKLVDAAKQKIAYKKELCQIVCIWTQDNNYKMVWKNNWILSRLFKILYFIGDNFIGNMVQALCSLASAGKLSFWAYL